MSEQEFDKVFKDAAENFSVSSDAEQWNDLRKRLDTHQKMITIRQRVIGGIALVLLFTVGSVLWFTGNDISESAVADSSPQEDKVTSNLSQHVPSEIQHEESVENVGDEKIGNKREQDSEESARITTPVSGINVVEINEENRVAVSLMTTVEPIKEADSTIKSELPAGSKLHDRVSEVGVDESVSDSLLVENKKFDSLAVREDSLKEERQNDEKYSGRWSAKVGISPDFSSINFFDPGKAGFNYGVLIGYAFSPRWTIYTGAISSRNLYSSTEVDEVYTSSQGYDYDVNKLDGDCRVLDVPLNIYYNISTSSSVNVSVGLGVSSYFMLSEDYDYHVSSNYGNTTYRQSLKSKNNEWFKIMNASILLQKNIGKNLFVEVEPYVKVPMAGIGEGKVNLVSIGSFVYLRYNFLSTKSK